MVDLSDSRASQAVLMFGLDLCTNQRVMFFVVCDPIENVRGPYTVTLYFIIYTFASTSQAELVCS